ncbi:uncharacterized protein LOC119628743 [Bombyx mori]|uniref:Uncharacterized protein n=1 Tax=Bombyx mori TaxID=7091 RepID=A0A8R2QU62_BOMMO|nr:SH3 domain-containing protein C23A1.17-like [Bombyx mori]
MANCEKLVPRRDEGGCATGSGIPVEPTRSLIAGSMRSTLASDSGAIIPTKPSAGKKRGQRKTPVVTSDDGGASSSSTEVPEKTMAIEDVAPVISGPAASKDTMPAPQRAPVRRRGAVSPATSVESMSTSVASLASGDETFRDLDLALVNLGKLLSTVAAKGAQPGSSYRKRLREGAAMVRTRLIPTMSKLYDLVASREAENKGLVAQLDSRESRIPGDSSASQGETSLSPVPTLACSGPSVGTMDTNVPSQAAMSVAAPMTAPIPVAPVTRALTPVLPRPPRRVELRPAPPPSIPAASASTRRGRVRPAPAQAGDIRSPLAKMVDEWPALPRPRIAEPPLSPPRAAGSQRPNNMAAGMGGWMTASQAERKLWPASRGRWRLRSASTLPASRRCSAPQFVPETASRCQQPRSARGIGPPGRPPLLPHLREWFGVEAGTRTTEV